MKKYIKKAGLILGTGIATAGTSFAATGGDYPWDTFLNSIAKDLSSNVVLSIGIMAVVGCGLVVAFGDLQSGAKRAVNVGLGLSIGFAATSIITKLFSGGAIIF